MYRIRKIEKRDNLQGSKIIRKVMTEYGAVGAGYSIEDTEVDNLFEAYNADRSSFYVIEKDDQLYGTGGIAPLQGTDEDVCELRKMYFLNELRGMGFGNKLMELCLEDARRFAFKRMYLETLISMKAANNLYKKFGFRPLDKNLGATGHFNCDAYYALEL